MAVVESIPEKVQTPSAQKGVLDYCMQPSKTFDEGEQLAYISGYNCIPEMANESFLATQKLFGHAAGGVRFYHFVQSFTPGENISPQEVNEIGMELVKSFGNREAIVATHIDREHLHNHIVVCAYDLDNGRKLHYNKFFLADLRKASDEICQAHGLKVLREYDPKVKSQRMKPKEYRAALNSNSMKLALCATIDFCMTRAKTQAQFREEMKKYGYEMVWTPERKYITYILRGRDGTEKRVRDKSLFDEKYRKENMEHEFRIREELYGQAQGEKYSATDSGGNADGRRNTDDTDQRRGVGRADRFGEPSGGAISRAEGTESGFRGGGGQVCRADYESDTGSERGDSGGDTKDLGGSLRTGWESERKSLETYLQKKHTGRRTVVASHGVRSGSDDTDLALMGIRGLENLTDILEDGDESEEEKREREARNTGTALGVAAGIIAGMAIGLGQDEDGDIEEDEDENEDFGMTM